MYQLNEKIAFVNEKGTGIIKKINADKTFVIENEDGFEHVYKLNEIAKIHNNTYQLGILNEKAIEHVIKKEKKLHGFKKATSTKNKILEVDLHIHELLNNWKHLSNFEILQIQLNHMRSKMSFAIHHKITKVIFIHGKGEGVLRNEVRQELLNYSNIEFFDASYLEYGQGATEVRIWYN